MIDLKSASSSSLETSCRFDFLLSSRRHVVVTTTPTNGVHDDSYHDLSFVFTLVIYIAISVFLLILGFLILKCLNAFVEEISNTSETTARHEYTETTPISVDEYPVYGTGEEEKTGIIDIETASSADLDDEKLCVICYDGEKNCFFVPCGHFATCLGCAQRTMAGQGKLCPICRMSVNKVKKLVHV